MSYSRLEKFIYAICSMDVTDLPVPLSRIEKLWNYLITGETPDFEPLSRNEKYLMAMLDRYDISNLPAPMSRGEKLLYKIAVGETDLSDVPGYLSRYEELLKYLIENGGISGGDFEYVLYTLNQSLNTLYTTAEKPVKSAILLGQTLVNLDKRDRSSYETLTATGSAVNDFLTLPTTLKTSTKYLIIIDIKEVTIDGTFRINVNSSGNTAFEDIYLASDDIGVGIHKKIVTSKSSFDGVSYALRTYLYKNNTTGYITYRTMILEYQEGMENWEIPYFQGMQSVKMPVLTTTGKNLLDHDNLESGEVSSSGVSIPYPTRCRTKNFIEVDNKNTLTLSKNTTEWFRVVGYDKNKNFVKVVTDVKSNNKTFNLDEEICFIKIKFDYSLDEALNDNIMLEANSVATPYEPYKSNILSTPEDLELRGIGKIKDELNLMTGEVIENLFNLDCSNTDFEISDISVSSTNTIRFMINNVNIKSVSDSSRNNMCNKLPYNLMWSKDEEGYYITNSNRIVVRLNKDKITSAVSREVIKNYLIENNFKFIVEKSEKSIKTVDLSDNHVYSYKDVTHYDCSSAEGSLVPTLSVKVPTDVQATIAQQRETIQTLNSENERLNQIQEALKASMLDSQVQLMNLSWDIDFEVFTLRESIAPKDSLMDSKTGSNIDKFSQAKFIIENDCPDLEKLNSQIEYYFSKDVFSQEQFEELTDLISIVKGENGCEY